MAGYETVLEIRRLEKDLDDFGLMMCHPKHAWGSSEYGEYVAVKPKDDDSLPIYTRDAELFQGTLRDLKIWMVGIQWARSYDMMLKISDEKKREKAEQKARNRQLMDKLKGEEKEDATH